MKRVTEQATFLRLVLGALGLGAVGAACGGVAVVESGDGQGGGGASGATSATSGTSASSATSATSGSSATSGTSASSTTGAGGAGGGCPAPSSQTEVDVPATGACSGFYMAMYVCFPAPNGPATCDDVYSKACVLDAYSCGFQDTGDEACGPDPAVPDGCCYTVVGDCPVGRPFLVDGQARLATRALRSDWADEVSPAVANLDPTTRAALADFWTREALSEHASVASFARFLLHLLAAGAPPELVVGAQRALADEVEHARLGFGLASAYAGVPVGPSALDVAGALGGGEGVHAMALAVAREGCIAETISALQVAAARDAATDPAVKQALSGIAAQEQEHALLAWRTLGWCLARGDAALHAAVAEVFAAPQNHVGLGPIPAHPGSPDGMRGHGCLPVEERRALAREALTHVVVPAARALLRAQAWIVQAAPSPREGGAEA